MDPQPTSATMTTTSNPAVTSRPSKEPSSQQSPSRRDLRHTAATLLLQAGERYSHVGRVGERRYADAITERLPNMAATRLFTERPASRTLCVTGLALA